MREDLLHALAEAQDDTPSTDLSPAVIGCPHNPAEDERLACEFVERRLAGTA